MAPSSSVVITIKAEVPEVVDAVPIIATSPLAVTCKSTPLFAARGELKE
jgi:hypothetical protein